MFSSSLFNNKGEIVLVIQSILTKLCCFNTKKDYINI